jgi:hypothetical protein
MALEKVVGRQDHKLVRIRSRRSSAATTAATTATATAWTCHEGSKD